MRSGPLCLLLSLLSLSSLAASAAFAADPPRKGAAKPGAGKKAPKAEEPPEEEPKPRRKPKADADADADSKAPAAAPLVAPEPEAVVAHRGTTFGGGLLLGMVFSSNNDSPYKLISPELGAQFVIDTVLNKGLYLRIEPTLSTFGRTASREAVVSAAGPKTNPVTGAAVPARIVQETITNRTRLVEIAPRVMLGYDFTPMLTARLGLILGVSLAKTSTSINETASDDCQDIPLRSGLVYGAALNPISVRFGKGKQTFELGLLLAVSKRTTSSCSRPLPAEGLSLKRDEEATVGAKVTNSDVTTRTIGLQATYLSW
jgi:hypothetical protein